MPTRPDTFRYNYFAPLAQGLVFAGLGFRGSDKSTRYHDSSLYGNNGTLTNMDPSSDWEWLPQIGQFGLHFRGTGGYVSVPQAPAFAFSSGYATISAWLNPIGTTNYATRMAINGYVGWRWVDGGSRQIRWDGGSDTYVIRGGVRPSTLEHYCFTCTPNGSGGVTVMSYVNGVWTNTGDQSALPNISTANLVIGSSDCEVILASPLIYNRTLSLPEIQALSDPSNVMLSGLILPPRRVLWPVATTGPAGISASAVCTGTNATVAAAATVSISAAAVATGTNATVASASKVAVSASAVCAGSNASVVAQLGSATARKSMMFMVC